MQLVRTDSSTHILRRGRYFHPLFDTHAVVPGYVGHRRVPAHGADAKHNRHMPNGANAVHLFILMLNFATTCVTAKSRVGMTFILINQSYARLNRCGWLAISHNVVRRKTLCDLAVMYTKHLSICALSRQARKPWLSAVGTTVAARA